MKSDICRDVTGRQLTKLATKVFPNYSLTVWSRRSSQITWFATTTLSLHVYSTLSFFGFIWCKSRTVALWHAKIAKLKTHYQCQLYYRLFLDSIFITFWRHLDSDYFCLMPYVLIDKFNARSSCILTWKLMATAPKTITNSSG